MSSRSRVLSFVAVTVAVATFGVAASAAAQNASLEHLQVHGYLSQGYAASSDLSIYGMNKEATGDYRSAALQFRYALSDNDNLVLQLRHRRLGTSPLNGVDSDVSVAWAFYQHRWGTSNVKIGKVSIPNGIYAGIRDVGTILPFYRAPYTYYAEAFETIDGAVLGHRTELGKTWNLDASLYGGGFTYKDVSATPGGPIAYGLRIERALGTQLWLETPVRGLRVGLGGMFFRFNDSSVVGEYGSTSFHASVDGTFSRLLLRSEYTQFDGGRVQARTFYAQGGYQVVPKLSLNGQVESSSTTTDDVNVKTLRDYAGGLKYAFTPNLVAKFEGHRALGYKFDSFVNPAGPRGTTTYGIASIAVSF